MMNHSQIKKLNKFKIAFSSESPLAQAYESPFTQKLKAFGVEKTYTFDSSLHWMMAQKARVFDDELTFDSILQTKDLDSLIKLGRCVKNFNSEIWKQRSPLIVFLGSLLKFQRNKNIKHYLMDTIDHDLLYFDKDIHWGCGCNFDSSDVQYEGENLLGTTLCNVRDAIHLGKIVK